MMNLKNLSKAVIFLILNLDKTQSLPVLILFCFFFCKILEKFSILLTYFLNLSLVKIPIKTHKGKVVCILLAKFQIRKSKKEGVKKSQEVSEMHLPMIWRPKFPNIFPLVHTMGSPNGNSELSKQ